MKPLIALTLLLAVAVPAAAQSVTADGATNITSSTAVLHGTVHPNGSTVQYVYFLIEGVSTPPQLHGVSTTTSWSYTVDSLPCATQLFYRAVAVFPSGETMTDLVYFTTGSCAFSVTTHAPTAITQGGFTAQGRVTPPLGSSADVHFQVGWSNYGWVMRRSMNTAVQTLSGSNVPFNATMTGLPCQTPVAYRAIGVSGSDTVFGRTQFPLIPACTGAESDFNADGRPDLVWRDPSTGALETWYYNRTIQFDPSFPAVLPSLGANVHVISAEKEDVSGKERKGWSDLMTWNATTGEVRRWPMMDGIASTSTMLHSASPASWRAVASFGASNTIVWHKLSTNQLLYFNTDSRSAAWLPSDPAMQLAGTSDFDKDGTFDLLYSDPAGPVRVWLVNPNFTLKAQYKLGTLPSPWIVVGAADFNLDGYPEVLIRNTSTGRTIAWVTTKNASGAIVLASSFPLMPDGDPAKTLVLPN